MKQNQVMVLGIVLGLVILVATEIMSDPNPLNLPDSVSTPILVVGLVIGSLVLAAGILGPTIFQGTAIKDGIAGSLEVIGVSMAPRSAVYGNISIIGVLSVADFPAIQVNYSGMCKVSRWPDTGTVLPVRVDRQNHSKFAILWDQVPSGTDQATQVAQMVANQMNHQPGSPTLMTGFVPPNALSASIVSVTPTGAVVDGKTEMVIALKINHPDGSIQDAQITKNVPPILMPQLTPGRIIQVIPQGDSWTMALTLPASA